MRKNLKYNIIGLALLFVGIVSCDTAEQDSSSIITPNDSYPVATFTTAFTGSTAAEGDTIVYTVTLNKPIDRALTFSARVVGGTGSNADIDPINGTISPYTLSTDVSFGLVQDLSADDAESLEIEIGLFSVAESYLVHPTTVNAVLSLSSVANYVPDVLTITCSWDKDIVINSNEEHHEDYTYTEHASDVDFDFEVYHDDITYVGGAGTGDSPEIIEIDGVDLIDGTYYVYSFLWENPFAYWDVDEDPETVQHTTVPVTTVFHEQGVFGEIEVAQAPGDWTNTADEDYANGSVVDYRLVAMFEVASGVVNVLDVDGNDLGGAKTLRTKISGNINR